MDIANIDRKMAAMRLKNLELLKRHQEIEEDRQLAVRLGATTDIETMRGGNKNRTRITTNQGNSQEVQYERIHRPPVRRKFENDRNDIQPQRAQRVDYNRLKREHARETTTNPELHEYTFHSRSNGPKSPINFSDNHEPIPAKKLVIVNNKAGRIGSGRFNQQQRTQEQGQRKREERMRRSTGQNNGGTNEFHLDVPPMPIWQNTPMHVQLIPNGHPTGMDHLINSSGDQLESAYIQNFVYTSPTQAVPFNSNGPIYFAPSSSAQTHFHQYHPSRTFENSNRHSFHLPPFQSSPIFQPPMPTSNDNLSADFAPRFRHLKPSEYENRQQRPMSGDFERLHNSRFQFRPQSFYDSNRHQRNPNPSLPLSAYMNTDNSNNQWGTTHSRRRSTPQQQQQQRTYHQDKHQFPLSLYDPRQYGFNNTNSSKRTDFNQRTNMKMNNIPNKEIDLIEEWWEDNNTELIETNSNTDLKTTIDDSGNSSLSTSMNFKETTSDDFVNPPSDVSTTDSNIIESLDKLQQQLKLEEAVDERIASSELNKEPTTYDTAHFMQWAKEKFREELAGRLTAQEIEQHDAVTTDDEEEPRRTNVEKMDALEDDLNEKLTIDENLSKSR